MNRYRRKTIRLSIVFTLLGLSLSVQAQAETVSKAVAQSVQGTKIEAVTVDKVANSNALQLSIKTSAGQKNIIVTPGKLKLALQALQNPGLTGTHNAAISTHLIYSNPVLRKAMSPVSTQASRQVTSKAAAMAVTAITTANQQASK